MNKVMSGETNGETAPGSRGAILVTGGTGGIGSAICAALAEPDSILAFTYRSNAEAADKLTAELEGEGVTVMSRAVALGDPDTTARFVHDVAEAGGGLRTVVHAAGPHIPMVHLSKVGPEQFRHALTDEAGAFFNLVSAALPGLRELRGNVVAVTTAATTRFPVRDGMSAGTKASIEALVRAFAAEEGRFGVRFNSVGPGMLTDGMADRLITTGELDEHALEVTRRNIPLRRFGRAVDVAAAVAFLASERANFITGQKLDIDGGYGV